MIAAKVAAALALIAVCSIAPGFLFVRRLRWSPLEKLNGAVALSLILVYCATFFIYAIQADPRWYWLISTGSLILGILAWRDFGRLFRAPAVRCTLAALALLLAWCLTALLLIRHFSGGGWMYDWLEHFHRTIFFVDRLPLDTRFETYHLTARPPMMNILAAFVLAHTGGGFEVFSAVFTALNVLAGLPCALLLRMMGTRRGGGVLLLAALLACSPFFVENATYTWTKLLAVFFILLGLWFYLAGWRKNDAARTTAAFVALAAGLLVHYSTGPYLLVIAAHYGVRVVTESRWREALIAAAISLALVGTWIGWSIASFGATTTLLTNTTVTSSREWEASGRSSTEKVIGNIASTLLPHPLLPSASMESFRQESTAGYVRDFMFLLFQTNVILGIGLIGGPIVLFSVMRALKKQRWKRAKAERLFWLFFLPATILLGIAVHGERDVFGVAHVTLQPIVLLGITYLAARFASFSHGLRWLVIAGCLIGAALGVLLQIRIQSLGRDTGTFEYSIDASKASIEWRTTLSRMALGNWWKTQSRPLLAEMLQRPEVRSSPSFQQSLSSQIDALREEDRQSWRGWHARNGGRITFLGDRARQYNAVIYILLAAMLGVFLTILIRATLRPVKKLTPPARPSASPPPGRPRGGRSRPRRSR